MNEAKAAVHTYTEQGGNGGGNKQRPTKAQMSMRQPVVGIFTEKGGSSKSDVAANLLGIILIKAWDLSFARRPVRGRRPYKSQSDGLLP